MRLLRRPPDFVIGDPERPYMLRWWNVSIVLRGAYREITPKGTFMRRTGSIVFRSATSAHRLELPVGEYGPGIRYCWTLFLTGPVIRTWGFHCPRGWVPWREFVNPDNPGAIGRGCGEPATDGLPTQ